MSKRNRERRAERRWQCRKCKEPMHHEVGRPEVLAAANRARGRPDDDARDVIHVCGRCRAFHTADGDGLRLLTPAEEFALRVDCPRTVAAAETVPCQPTVQPTATLVYGED